MKICSHCGANVDDNQQICLNCGCKCETKVQLTLTRKESFVGCLVPMNIMISGSNFAKKVPLSNGETKSLEITSDTYVLDMTLGVNKGKFQIDLRKNTHYEVSIKMGMAMNTFVIKEV